MTAHPSAPEGRMSKSTMGSGLSANAWPVQHELGLGVWFAHNPGAGESCLANTDRGVVLDLVILDRVQTARLRAALAAMEAGAGRVGV